MVSRKGFRRKWFWSHREEHRLMLYENRVPRAAFGPEGKEVTRGKNVKVKLSVLN
jgi:hypothetical protein